MELDSSIIRQHQEDVNRINEAALAAGQIVCEARIKWLDGRRFGCERSDPHDGEKALHGADIDEEWTSWSSSYAAHRERVVIGYFPDDDPPSFT